MLLPNVGTAFTQIWTSRPIEKFMTQMQSGSPREFVGRSKSITANSLQRADKTVRLGNRGVHIFQQLRYLFLDIGRFSFERCDGSSVQVVLHVQDLVMK